MTTKIRTNTGKVAGAVVAVPDYDEVTGTTAVYYDPDGNMAVNVNVATGSTGFMADTLPGGAYLQLTIEFGFTAAPSQAIELSQQRNNSAKIGSILVGPVSGAPYVRVRGGADAALTGWTANTTVALNTRYRIQIAIQRGTGTTDGKTKARLTRVSDAVVLAEGESTTLNNGTANLTRAHYGKLSATGTNGAWIDQIALGDNAYDYLPAATDPNYPPVVDAGPDLNVEAGDTWSITAPDSDPDGTIVTRSWTLAGSPVSTDATVSGTAPISLTDTVQTYTYTATDNQGSTTSDTVTVTLLAATRRLRLNGAWVPSIRRIGAVPAAAPPAPTNATVGTIVQSFLAAAYPTSGTLTGIDTSTANVLVGVAYVNSSWAGGNPVLTYQGQAMTLVDGYANVTAGNGYWSLFTLANPPATASGSLVLSQASPNYNAEKTLMAIPVIGGNPTAPLRAYAGTSRGSSMPWLHTLTGLTIGDPVVDIGWGYYLNNPPSTTDATLVAANSANSATRYAIYQESATATSETNSWTADVFNYATSLMIAFAGA